MTTKLSAQFESEVKPPVVVKGTKEGLLFILDEQCDFEVLLTHVEDLLLGENAGLFSGSDANVALDYGRRKMTRDQLTRLLKPFLEKENFLVREWGPQTVARKALLSNAGGMLRQTILKGTVRAGQQLMFEGDVVIVGDVNPGAEVMATGDIFVFGRLRGVAHAGSEGDRKAVIGAVEFSPMQIRIANSVSRSPEVGGQAIHTSMEFAYLRDDGMAVDRMQYLASLRQRT